MVKIHSKRECCGCLACVQICPKQCIEVAEDSRGFNYPLVNQDVCIDCGLCERVCPFLHISQDTKPLDVCGLRNPNEEIRLLSSSGGIFTELAENTIALRGVVFGAKFDINWNVVHDCTENVEGLKAFRGSKYVQSYIGDNYKRVKAFLEAGREVLFSGTPCQVKGLQLFLHKNYNNLTTVEIVCHGVPSPKVWRNYLEDIKIKLKASSILAINFRDKSFGWHSYHFSIKYLDTNGKERQISMPHGDNLYFKGYLNHLYIRPSCYNCPSKHQHTTADITIGDLWGIEQIAPDFDDNKGCSLVCINTEKGQKMAKDLLGERKLCEYEQVVKFNPALVKSIEEDSRSELFWSSNKRILSRIENICGDSLLLKAKKYIRRMINNPQKYCNDN